MVTQSRAVIMGIMVVVATWATLAHGQSQEALSQRFTLEQAIEYARANSPRLRAALQGVVTQSEAIAAAKALRVPRLTFDLSPRVTDDPTGTALELSRSGISDVLAGSSPSQGHLNAAVSVEWPLYLGGEIGARTRQAQAERRVTRAFSRDIERDLLYDVVRLYARLFEFDQDIRAAERSVEALEESRHIVAQMLTQGRRPRVDLLKVETRLAGVRDDLVRFKNARRVAAGRLNAVLGQNAGTPIAVVEKLPKLTAEVPLEQALAAAQHSNPELQAAVERVAAAKHSIEVEKSRLRPSVSLVAGYRAQQDNTFNSGAVAGVVLRWPLFDQTLSRRADKARSRRKERQWELAQLRLDIEERVHTAYARIEDARSRIEATTAALASSTETLRIEGETLRLGLTTVEDFLDAQAAFLRTQAKYYEALADHIVAAVALQRDSGIELIPGWTERVPNNKRSTE